MSELARELQERSTAQEVLDHVVATAVAMVPGAEDAAITFAEPRRTVTTAAATSERGRRFDTLQQETGQGP